MGRQRGWGFTAEQKRQIWGWWKAGQTTSVIGRALQVNAGLVHYHLASDGGIVRASRRRRRTALTTHDREEIMRGLAMRTAPSAIARALDRAPSTITREIRRNGGVLEYRAGAADEAMWARAKRPQRCRLAEDARLCAVVAAQLLDDWSPCEIAARLVIEYPDDPTMRVSHETIYRTLYIQARGALKKELVAHLRRRHAIRRPRRDPLAPPRPSRIPHAVSIAARPEAGGITCTRYRSDEANPPLTVLDCKPRDKQPQFRSARDTVMRRFSYVLT